ncbi:hypothetical protein B0H21DRAFT_885970 [Amylocystis lapponica]|nr:hypothetical protein B0H21DRAFT_885970 [Amylocystis lapponica]
MSCTMRVFQGRDGDRRLQCPCDGPELRAHVCEFQSLSTKLLSLDCCHRQTCRAMRYLPWPRIKRVLARCHVSLSQISHFFLLPARLWLNIVSRSTMAPLSSHKVKLASGASPSDSLETPRHLLHSATRRARMPMSDEFLHPPSLQAQRLAQSPQLIKAPDATLYPKKLEKPQDMPDVYLRNVYAYEPTMVPVPLDYIRRGMLSHGPQYVAAYRGFRVEPPPTGFPPEMNFGLSDSLLAFCPTHLLAVYEHALSDTASPAERIAHDMGHGRAAMLYPVHAIPSRHHAHPAPEPGGRPADNMVRLPVVPFVVPHLPTFVLLERFLYTHDVDKLHAQLIPIPEPRESSQALREQRVLAYAKEVARSAQEDMLSFLVERMFGLWRNAAGLGIDSCALWETLEFDWDVLMEAVQIMQRDAQD